MPSRTAGPTQTRWTFIFLHSFELFICNGHFDSPIKIAKVYTFAPNLTFGGELRLLRMENVSDRIRQIGIYLILHFASKCSSRMSAMPCHAMHVCNRRSANTKCEIGVLFRSHANNQVSKNRFDLFSVFFPLLSSVRRKLWHLQRNRSINGN